MTVLVKMVMARWQQCDKAPATDALDLIQSVIQDQPGLPEEALEPSTTHKPAGKPLENDLAMNGIKLWGMLRMSLSSRIGISSDDNLKPPEDVERCNASVFTIQIQLYNSPPSHYSSLSDGQGHAQDIPLVKNWTSSDATSHLHITLVFQMDRGMLRTPLLSRIGISNDNDFEPPEDVKQRDMSVFTIQIRLYNSPPSHYSGLSDGQECAQDVPLIKNRYLKQ
ncbi:hypothetical protein BKA83DRAFT_4127871 [Pisolithus microcarpus]|nr:hypothetical protein BKA83DRAFT_4127871 [Pisolithus microcarpus]